MSPPNSFESKLFNSLEPCLKKLHQTVYRFPRATRTILSDDPVTPADVIKTPEIRGRKRIDLSKRDFSCQNATFPLGRRLKLGLGRKVLERRRSFF